MPESYETLAGTIVAPHGIQGTVKVRPATPTAGALILPSLPVWIGTSSREGSIYEIVSAKRLQPKGALLVRFDKIDSRTEAERLVGLGVYTPDTRRAPLSADEYFVQDLIGLTAATESGHDLGRVTDVISQPAGDVYETDRGILIPAVKAFVAQIDLAGGRLVVRDVAGLDPSEQEEA